MSSNFAFKGTFSDVHSTDWYASSVEYLASLGILKGYDQAGGGYYFNPAGTITRAEFAVIIDRIGNLPKSSSFAFKDIGSAQWDWARDSINAVGAKGWLQGYEDGGFRPANNITRAEVVTIVNRMLGRVPSDYDLSKVTPPFDVSKTHWAYNDILMSMGGEIK